MVSPLQQETGMIITWRTHKTDEGFKFEVIRMGYGVPSESLKSGIASSRAKAALMAKKWARYFKQAQQAA
jgi:hypothetical protein